MKPVVAVLAILARGEDVLLVRRANPPDAGLWGFPGGKVEPGETLAAATEREAFEETGIRCAAGRAFTALDAFHHEAGQLRAHYVLIAVPCRWLSGEPVAGDDALEAAWVRLADLAGRDDLSADVESLARTALGHP